MADVFKEGNTAVITGGASGIGLALAKKCAGYGMKVVVADRDAAALAAVPAAVASPHHMDVSRAEDWDGLRAKVHEVLGGRITLLALNAGTGGRHGFGDGDGAAFEKILAVNVLGVVHGITTLLPLVREATAAGPAAVVVTGSKQGITNPPGNPAYNASKAAVKSLAEQLAYDLRATPVAVHLLVPGWTWTGLAGGAPPAGRDAPDGSPKKPAAAWWPEEVADYLEVKMRDGQFWVLCPDNEVTEEMDRKRMMWTAEDAIQGRPPLSRWRGEFKEQVAEFMSK